MYDREQKPKKKLEEKNPKNAANFCANIAFCLFAHALNRTEFEFVYGRINLWSFPIDWQADWE